MRRKLAQKLLKSLGRLRSTTRLYRDDIARDLGRRLAAPHAAVVAYRPVLQHLEAEITALELDLARAEDAYAAEKERPAELRERRRRAAAGLYQLHSPLRRLLAVFPEIEVAGIASETPKDPHAMVLQAGWTIDFLRQLEGDPPPPSRGLSIEPGTVAGQLEDARRELAEVLVELELAEDRTRVAREEAEAAIERCQTVGSWVTQVIEGLAGLAGAGSVSSLTSGDR